MNSKTAIFFKYFLDSLHERPIIFHLQIVIFVFIPFVMLFNYFEWSHQFLVFLCFGYLSAFIGYHFSNREENSKIESIKFRKHYRLIAENLKDIVIVHRLKDGKNEYINTATNNILGYFQKDLIGQSTLFIIHPQDQKKVKIQLSNIASLDDYFFVETIRVRCKNGNFKWMELNVKTLKNEFGNSTFAIFTFRDISETIELEKANKQFAEELFGKYMNKDKNRLENLVPIMITSK